MSKCRMLSFILIVLFAVGLTGCTGSVTPVETGAPSWSALSEDLLTDLTEEGISDKKTGSTVERTEKTEKEQPEEETNAAVDSVQMDPPCPTQQPNGSTGTSDVSVDPPLQTQEPSESAQPVQRQEPEPAKPEQSSTQQAAEPAAPVKPSESSRVEQPSEPPIPSASATSEESIPPTAAPSEAETMSPRCRRLRNQAFHSLLKRLKAIHRRIATASSEKPLPTQKAIGKRGSPSNGRNRWNSDGRSGIWVHQGSGRRVWTGRSAD